MSKNIRPLAVNYSKNKTAYFFLRDSVETKGRSSTTNAIKTPFCMIVRFVRCNYHNVMEFEKKKFGFFLVVFHFSFFCVS